MDTEEIFLYAAGFMMVGLGVAVISMSIQGISEDVDGRKFCDAHLPEGWELHDMTAYKNNIFCKYVAIEWEDRGDITLGWNYECLIHAIKYSQGDIGIVYSDCDWV